MELTKCLAPTFDEFRGRSTKHYFLNHLRRRPFVSVEELWLRSDPLKYFSTEAGIFSLGGFAGFLPISISRYHLRILEAGFVPILFPTFEVTP
jgi:hypothetical protein